MRKASHAQGKGLIKSILDYFSGMEKLATISNDRRAVLHFQECWETTWRAFYGGYSIATHSLTLVTDSCEPPVVKTKPAWFITKYSRPTRKVIGRIQRKVSLGKNRPPLVVSYDILDCGHELEGNETHGAAKPARHRRCAQCLDNLNSSTAVAGAHNGKEVINA